ncbi:MAG TPA: hypothetical protein VN843_13895, partial [Anaerolineales bacterium]|nr:hypothetical protein [Anaerolineales bacterium]
MSNKVQSVENKPEEHRLDFFRHDQITFLVTHESNLDDRIRDGRLTDKILQEWSAELNEHLKRQKWMLSQKVPIRSYSFPALGDNVPEDLPDDYLTELFSGAPFSIIACNVERVTNQEQSDNKSTTLAENNKKRAEEKGLLYNLILSLDSEHENLSAAGLAVQGVFP